MFRKIFGAKEDKAQSDLANSEIRLVDQHVVPIFNSNNSFFYGKGEASTRLAIELAVTKPPLDVVGLFVVGVIMEIIADQPRLPTPAYDRAFVHLIRFFAQQYEQPFEEARQRVAAVRGQLDDLDRFAAYIVTLGREAVTQEEPDMLDRAYQAAYRASLLRT